jgi:hypothetical protein
MRRNLQKSPPVFGTVDVRYGERNIEVGRHQVSDDIHHLPVARVQRGLNMAEADRVEHATQRMNPPCCIPQDGTRCILEDRLTQHFSQRGGFDARQITSDDQVVSGASFRERGFEPRQWTVAGPKIIPALPFKRAVQGRRTQQDGGSRSLLHPRRDMSNQWHLGSKRKQRFVLPHARTAASNEDKPGRSHVRMVAPGTLKSGYNRKNKVRLFCFISAFGMFAGSVLAGEQALVNQVKPKVVPVAVPGAVSVVRVGRDGRLIRVLTPTSSQLQAPVKLEPPPSVTAAVVTPMETVLAPTIQSTPAAHGSETIDSLIEEASSRYQVDPLLVKSVMQVESNFNPAAVSPKGAQGLMQLIPATAQRFGVTDPFDSRQNIEGGVKYLRYLQDLFPTDLRLSLAAYNAGEGAVAKYGAIPPYRETVDYVQKVHQRYSNAKGSRAPVKSASAEEPAEPTEPLVRHIEQVIDSEGRLFLRTR